MRRAGFSSSGWRAAALVPLAALALAACGGNGGDEDEQVTQEEGNAVTRAAAATLDEETAAVAYEATFEGPEGMYSFTARGEVDYETFRSRLAYDLSNVPDGGDNAEVRLDGGTVYVRFPEGSQDVELPEGREWIRLPSHADVRQAAEESGEEAPPPTVDVGGIQQDPTLFLRYLGAGATEVLEEGTEDVRGARTTIYTATIDLDRVIDGGGAGLAPDEEGRQDAVRAAEGLRDQIGGTGIPVTVNVDEEGRVRRLLLSLDIAAQGGGRVSALTTTEYFDFGSEVDTEPPPEDTVVDAADVG